MKLPAPGLLGNYEDSCVVCLEGTDTILAFRGIAGWIEALLEVLGIPEDQAVDTVSVGCDCPRGEVPEGIFTMTFRVCSDCASKANVRFPAPVLLVVGVAVPCVVQPEP